MDVAVVIPLYNGARWVRQTLASVFAQTRPPAQVCVVDDGSTDGSPDIARSFPGVSLLTHPGKGSNPAREHGRKHTAAPLVAFLDQDDLWQPEHLQLLVAALQLYPECPAAAARTFALTAEVPPGVWDPHVLTPWAPFPFTISSQEIPTLQGIGHTAALDPWIDYPFNRIYAPSSVLIRRAALERIGGWPTRLPGVADLYTWLRLTVRTPMAFSSAATVFYRIHGVQQSHSLRSRDPAGYLENHRAAAADALAHRLADRPQDAPVLQRRLAVFTTLAGLLPALLAADPARVRAAAAAFEQGIAGKDALLLEHVDSYLKWFLEPALKAQGPLRQTFRDILRSGWMVSAPVTRSLLLACLQIHETPTGG